MCKINSDISVCIAFYEGSLFIEEQLESLLSDINENDEVILINDSPWECIESLRLRYPTIKYYENPTNLGYVSTFTRAIALASNDLVFFCDQDDIWVKGKKDKLVNALEDGSLAICSYYNFDMYGYQELITQPAYNKRYNTLLNILLGRYPIMGCVMAINKSSLQPFVHIPKYVGSHDIYFGIVACLVANIVVVQEPLVFHRLHNRNLSKKSRPLIAKIKSRFWMIKTIFDVFFRRHSVFK